MQLVQNSQQLANFPIGLWSFKTSQFFGSQSFQDLHSHLSSSNHKLCLCEYMQFSFKLRPYIDIEWERDQIPFRDINDIIIIVSSNIRKLLGKDFIIKTYVREACGMYTKNATKTSESRSYFRMSYHILFDILSPTGTSIYIRNKHQLNSFAQKISAQFFDSDAYKGFNLRLTGQDKFDKHSKKYHNRILRKVDDLTDTDSDLFMFVSYCPNPNFLFIDDFFNLNFFLDTIRSQGYIKSYTFNNIKFYQSLSRHSLLLTEQKCPLRTHQNNNSQAMFYTNNQPNITIKCLDDECQASKTFWLHIDTDNLKIFIKNETTKNIDDDNKQISVGYPIENQHLQDCIYKTGQDIFIKSGSIAKQCQYIGPNRFSMDCLLSPMFQNSNKHNFYSDNDNCKNNFNDYSFPIDIGVLNALKMLKQEYTMDQLKSLNIHIGDVNNYITNNNTTNHFHNKEDEVQIKSKSDISDIQFGSDDEQTYVYKLFRGRMNYITSLYNILVPNDFIYIPCDKKDKTIFYFTNFFNNKKTKGGLWTNTDGIKQLKKRIRNTLENYFDKLISQDNLDKKILKKLEFIFKNVLSIIDQQGKIEQYAMETYQDSSIVFNQNKHLIHFFNGTFDLDNQEFIQTTPDMYNTQMISYEYNKNQSFEFIEPVLRQIIGSDEYPWFIKQLSNCLHPDRVIEQKQIVILTGQGNNGKTLIFNLMNNTMDTSAYGVNGRSILLQASNEQMSAATPDLMLLKDKRFCNFPELDSKKPFNQQQVKQLTGGDMIQGRNLYDQLQEFKPQAGLFISCNKLPTIDTTDGGFLNRIKLLELKNQFVDNPEHQFHIKKDKKLLGKIETKKWRQAFFNLLLHFFCQDDLPIPDSIQSSIQSKVDLNLDPIEIWGEQNLQFLEGSYLIPEKAKDEYNDKTNSHISSTKYFQKELQQYFLKYPQKYSNVKYQQIRLQNDDDILNFGKRLHVFINVTFQ